MLLHRVVGWLFVIFFQLLYAKFIEALILELEYLNNRWVRIQKGGVGEENRIHM